MSFLTTNKKLKGKFKITKHARKRFKERLGERKIGNRKVKNLGQHKVDSIIRRDLREKRYRIKDLKQDDGAIKVYTEHFNAIVIPGFSNKVITIY